MFGFQRVADLIWAAADQRSRGFLVGATSGRTTLAGEGLQHQDGNSHLVASTVPNCRAYDPCFAYEVAVIVEEGMRAMLERGEDVFYYLTVTNENTAQERFDPAMREGIVRGMYRLDAARGNAQVRLLGSAAILPEVRKAAALLRDDFGIDAEVFSVTSFGELQRDGMATERNRLRAMANGSKLAIAATWVEQCLGVSKAPVIAATDYVRAVPELIRAQIGARYVTLGTDGFGRSDTRAALRRFFEVDSHQVVLAALAALASEGSVDAALVGRAARRYGISIGAAAPWEI
jgi:pyruvate dehydrogenase E1 component